MIVNKYTLRDKNICEKDIQRLFNKARKLLKQDNYFDAMVTTNGKILSVTHFNANVLLDELIEYIKTLRSDAIALNKRLIKILRDIKA